jgi:hypothetical protein
MNAESFTRLRLERLETRCVLSATALPPALALPDLAPGEYSPIGAHPAIHAELQDAAGHAAVMRSASPVSVPDQPVANSIGEDSESAIDLAVANDEQSPVAWRSPVGDRLADMPMAQYADPVGVRLADMPIAPDADPDGVRLADMPMAPGADPVGDAASPVPSASDFVLGAINGPVSPGIMLQDPHPDANSAGELAAGPVGDGPGGAENQLPTGQRPHGFEEALTLTFYETRVGSPSELATEANNSPQGSDDAAMPGVGADYPGETPTDAGIEIGIDFQFANHAPFAGRPSSRGDDLSSPPPQNSASLPSDYSPVPLKPQNTDASLSSDAIPVDLAAAAVEPSLSPVRSGVNSPAALASYSNSLTSNLTEGGFIPLEDGSANSPLPGYSVASSSAASSSGVAGLDGTQLDGSSWLSDIQPNVRKPADSGGSRMAARANDYNVLSPYAPVAAQSPSGVEDRGGIELAIADPSPAASDDSPGGQDHFGDQRAQKDSDIRVESDLGLFCDIEIADAPSSLPQSAASAASHPQSSIPAATPADSAAAGNHGRKSSAGNEFEPRLTKTSQPILAGLEGQLPVILVFSVLVSRGGLRLEEKDPQRERRLQTVRGLR